MKLPKGFLQLFSIMLILSLMISGLTIYILYTASVDRLKIGLADAVKNQASMVEAMMDTDQTNFKGLDNSSHLQQVVQKLVKAHLLYEAKRGQRKFTIARKIGSNISFLLSHQHLNDSIIAPVPFDSQLAEPMRRALMGQQGELIGQDYQGVTVLAAYYPIVRHQLGVVAKIDLDLIRWTFIKAGLLAVALSLLLIALGSWIFYKISNPIIRTMELNKINLERALEETRNSDHKFRSIFYQTFQMIELLDTHGNVLETNHASLWKKGSKNSKIVETAIKDALKGKPTRREIQISNETGEDIFIDFSMKPILDEEGSILFLISEGYDISERKLIEKGLTKSTRAYQLLSLCNQAIFKLENETELLNEICNLVVDEGNYSMCWIGYAQEDEEKSVIPVGQAGVDEDYFQSLNVSWGDNIRGQGPTGTAIRTGKLSTVMDIPNSPLFNPWRKKVLQRGYISSISIPLISGQKTIGALSIYSDNRSSFDKNEIELLQGLANDLSFGINALQDKTLKSKYEFEMLRMGHAMEQVADSIIITDTEGKIEYVNSSFEKVTGYSKDYIIGKTPNLLNSGQQPPEYYLNLWEVLRRGEIWSGYFINKKSDGSYFQEDATISPIRNSEGEIVNYVAVKQDITEKIALEKQLKQSQKLEAIGTLAGGIAHDFNNLLFAILGYVELALKKTPSDSPLAKYLDIALNAGSKAKHLISQILTFSRQSDSHPVAMEMAPLLRDATEILRSMLPSSIEIDLKIPDNPLCIFADPTQMQQVIINLCTNASQAMEERPGKIEILCQIVKIDQKKGLIMDLSAGDYLQMIFKDQGNGMTPKVMNQIFNPFFTTKPVNKGTGLGLSIVHGIVKTHDGAISVQSTPNKGTSFFVHFPLSSQSEEISDQEAVLPLKGDEKILVVDDQPAVASLVSLLLQEQGYQVEYLTEPKEALQLIDQGLEDFDLLITDQTMPEINGTELIHEIRKKHKHLKIILITGLSNIITGETIKTLGISDLLQKPIDEDSLIRSVQGVLNETTGGKLE